MHTVKIYCSLTGKTLQNTSERMLVTKIKGTKNPLCAYIAFFNSSSFKLNQICKEKYNLLS